MITLDENFPDSQRLILAGWRIAQPGITMWRMRQDDKIQITWT